MPSSTLLKDFENKKISRRQFITHLTALGVSASLIPSFLPTEARANTPKKGGHFRMGMDGGHTTDSLDAAVLADQIEISTSYAVRNNLVEVNHKGEALPELAESWDVSTGAKEWAFNLRKGVEFHNGKSLDSQDVVYSIRHHMGKDSKPGAKGLVDQIQDIQAQGKHQVVFTLKDGNADFPYVLNDYHLVMVPDGTQGQAWEEGVGTGGYILESWEPGVRVQFKRNPNYFKTDRAHFDSVEILAVKDASSRTNALRTGQVDYMNRVELKTVHLFKRTPGIDVLRVNGGHHYTLPMHTDVAPFNNN
ncbi:MAG: ABC transporter substrate-binding protein, partial [Desulfobacterales bacterium]|nr:ABC transporter substrate-binding protein [Desulfobacterales bacterium]